MNFKNNFSAIATIAVLLAFCLALACGCTEDEKAAEALKTLTSGVPKSFSETLLIAEITSYELKSTDDRNLTQVNAILDESQKALPWIESVAFIGPDGTVSAIMPDTYSDLVGADLSYQDIVAIALAIKSPLMSDYMLLAEGEKGMLIEYPVLSEDNEYVGIVSIVIDPATMIEPYAEEIKADYGFSVMVTQPDALILYAEDPAEIGNETIGNPVYEKYPDIIECANACAIQPAGTCSYTFVEGSEKEVTKKAVWDTVKLLGKEWRLFVIREA